MVVARRLGADPAAQAGAGLAACIGHSWPVFARFRGGKAVATAAGALVVVSPPAFAFAAAGGVGGLILTRTMSVGSLAAAGVAVWASVADSFAVLGLGGAVLAKFGGRRSVDRSAPSRFIVRASADVPLLCMPRSTSDTLAGARPGRA